MRELGESFDLPLSHSVPSRSLMDEWRRREVEEMGGSPRLCCCVDKSLILFNFSFVSLHSPRGITISARTALRRTHQQTISSQRIRLN